MSSYEAKQDRRRERYEQLAENNRDKSAAEFRKADLSEGASGIPFGQPILVGHHSEKRHRRAIDRADSAMRRSVDASEKADYYASKAAGVGTGGISSDDPEAVTKLLEKIEAAQKWQDTMKIVNKIVRSGKEVREKLEMIGIHEPAADELLKPDYAGRVGIPGYQLTNNNANIRRMRQRVETLRQKPTETKETERSGIKIIENAEENRIQLVFDGKPSAEIRAILKSNGFRWSRYNVAWQRHLNAAGRYAASYAIDRINELV